MHINHFVSSIRSQDICSELLPGNTVLILSYMTNIWQLCHPVRRFERSRDSSNVQVAVSEKKSCMHGRWKALSCHSEDE